LKVHLLVYTSDPDRVCAIAALATRSSKDPADLKVSRAVAEKALKVTIASGHHSVLEHANFTFSISGVSRALTHQLVRHRIASYSQQSQRYVTLETPGYVTPDSISRDEQTLESYKSLLDGLWEGYKDLIAHGVPEEDARYLLPNAAETHMVMTMNARELMHFFRLRCCLRAQWEIRRLAFAMLKLVKNAAPVIFEDAGPSCFSGRCPEKGYPCRIKEAAERRLNKK